jgi:hypothetical protein
MITRGLGRAAKDYWGERANLFRELGPSVAQREQRNFQEEKKEKHEQKRMGSFLQLTAAVAALPHMTSIPICGADLRRRRASFLPHRDPTSLEGDEIC